MDELIKDFVSNRFSIYDINPALSFTVKNNVNRTYQPETIEVIAGLAYDIKFYQFNNNIFSSPIKHHEKEYIQEETAKEKKNFEDKINQCIFPNTHWFVTDKGFHYYHHQYIIQRSDNSDSFDTFFALQWSCYSLYEMKNFLTYHYGKHDSIEDYPFYLQMLLIQFEDFFENLISVQRMLDMFLKNLDNTSVKNDKVQVIKQVPEPIILFELDTLLEILLPYFPNEKDDSRLRAAFYNEDLSFPLYFSESAATIGYLFIQLDNEKNLKINKSKTAKWLNKYITTNSQKSKEVKNIPLPYAEKCLRANNKEPRNSINLEEYFKQISK